MIISQRGFALPLVLGIAVLLTVIIFSISATVSHRVGLITELDNAVRAEMKSYSAFNQVIFTLLSSPTTFTTLLPGPEAAAVAGDQRPWSLYGEEIELAPDLSVRIRDAAGMLSPLFAGEGLGDLFTTLAADREEAARLVDALADWQDRDDFRRLHGAEAWDYRAAGLAHTPRNAPIQTLGELLLIKGFEQELLDKIAADLVYWHPGNVNYLTMSPELLGLFVPDQAQLEQVLALRAEGSLTPPLFTAITGIRETEYDFFWPSSILQITIDARRQESRNRITALVSLRPGREQPFMVLEWRR